MYDKYLPLIKKIASVYPRDYFEDLLQEAYLHIDHICRRNEPDIPNLKIPFLAPDLYRRFDKYVNNQTSYPYKEEISKDDKYSSEETIEIQRILERLPEKDRQMIYDYMFLGKSSKELGLQEGFSAESIRKRNQRILDRLREMYGKEIQE